MQFWNIIVKYCMNKIFSDFHLSIPSQPEAGNAANTELWRTKLIYSNAEPLICHNAKDRDVARDNSDPVQRGNACLIMYHCIESKLDLVGLQIWSSTLIMADWIMQSRASYQHANVLELGCGTGLLSILISSYCREVYATDCRPEVLQLCALNAEANTVVNVNPRILDWERNLDSNFARADAPEQPDSPYCLGERDRRFFNSLDLVLASDCVYDDELTDAFLRTVHDLLLLNIRCRVVVFVQRRVICSHSNEQVSPHFEHWATRLDELHEYVDARTGLRFVVDRLNVTGIDQYLQYESRPSDVHGFQISVVTDAPESSGQARVSTSVCNQ